jgi:hypothetical protein
MSDSPPAVSRTPAPRDPGRAWDRADAVVRAVAVAVLAAGVLAWSVPGGSDVLAVVMAVTCPPWFGIPPFLAGPFWAAVLGLAWILAGVAGLAAGAMAGRRALAESARRNLVDGLGRLLGAGASFLSAALAGAGLTLLAGLAGAPLPTDGPGQGTLLYVPLLAASVAALTPRAWLLPHLDARIRAAGGRIYTVPTGPLADVGALLEGLFVGALSGQFALLGALALALLAWGVASLLLAGRDSLAFGVPLVRALSVAGAAAFATARWLWPRLRRTGLFHLRRIEASADGRLRFYGPFGLPLGALGPGRKVAVETAEVVLTRRGGGRRIRLEAWLESGDGPDGPALRVELVDGAEERPAWLGALREFLRA